MMLMKITLMMGDGDIDEVDEKCDDDDEDDDGGGGGLCCVVFVCVFF